MSDTFFALLLVQAVTVTALRVRLRTGWLRRPVTRVVLALVVRAIEAVRYHKRSRRALRSPMSWAYLSYLMVGGGSPASVTEGHD